MRLSNTTHWWDVYMTHLKKRNKLWNVTQTDMGQARLWYAYNYSIVFCLCGKEFINACNHVNAIANSQVACVIHQLFPRSLDSYCGTVLRWYACVQVLWKLCLRIQTLVSTARFLRSYTWTSLFEMQNPLLAASQPDSEWKQSKSKY